LVYLFNCDKQMLKWMLCIVAAFVKDVYSISWNQFGIWIIRLFTMFIVMFSEAWVVTLTNLKCVEFDNLLNIEFLHKTSFCQCCLQMMQKTA
jgi:hypothetical protein